MWELKNIINQCVKCKSKFTSAEKPLKLLPCLHSMCLDCLYGRTPARRLSSTTSPAESKSEAKKEHGPGEKSEEEGSHTAELESTPDKKDGENNDQESNVTEAVSTAENSEKDGESPSKETTSIESNKKSSDENAESGDKEESGSKDDTFESTDNPQTGEEDASKIEPKKEIVETKPKPVTECPVCRDPIDQPSSALMDNMFAVLDPDQPATPQPDSTHVCTACEENQEASSYCQQCEEWLCDSCVDAHKRVRITKDHTISPKDEVKVVASKSPWEQLMMCKQHRQEHLKFFCEKCETLTCRDCQLMDHKEHKYQFLDQAAEQYKARLKGSLALMSEKRTKLATNRDEIEQKLHNCKEQKDSLQQDILKQADILVKGIRQAVWGVLSNLASFTDAATKRLNKEIDDVSDLIGKFDHCIQFMEDILREGSSMSLLYSKANVETKCRKVYHTQVDPQSLKGTLSIVYKHEVNSLLGSLSKIGSIFVNGVRYPPDKNGGHGNRQGQNYGYQDPRSGGLNPTSPHLQHMANQPVPGQRVQSDWTKFIQTVSKPANQSQGPPNMTMSALSSSGSLPPQLTLPSNRRPQGNSIMQAWQGAPGMPSHTFPGHFVAGQLLTPQQQQTGKPTFQPMRLHHRPATQAAFPGQGEHRSQSMRSPPQYRMGGEASGTSRSSLSTPDPARPASAGMYDGNGRPDSGEGSVIVDVKKEKRDHSPDCVIMSTSLKSDRSSAYPSLSKQSETVLEMQRNLDEVLRAVPMDLCDNLEQISGSRPRTSVDREQLKSPTCHDITDGMIPQSPTDQELRDNWQGGDSMPGFSLSQTNSHGDPNDDYCACCHNGGDVLCCDRCPKVFHLQCHIPELPAVPSGSFICTLCEGDNPINHEELSSSGKRKTPGGLPDQELKVCERILLELFCHPSSVPFQEPVNRAQVPNYYKIITQPKDFTQIKCRLQRSHHSHYQSVKSFIYDLRQVFINCAIYNKKESEVGKAGKIVRALFESLVEQLMPQYLSFVKENPTPCFSALQQQMDSDVSNGDGNDSGESSPKRIKTDD